MQLDKIYESLELLAENVKRCIQASMEKNGINDKIGVNTLIDSHIYDELDVSLSDIELIDILINNYYQYIESGTEPGHWVDEKYLLPWMEDKGISTDNNTLWHIQDSIYRFGISPRPFLDDAWQMVEEYWDDFAPKVFEILTDDLTDWFSN